jgi:hypothetical protein
MVASYELASPFSSVVWDIPTKPRNCIWLEDTLL